ncbi:uncharacterized protein V6R79_007881 [Siganus canaliculatus]
MTVGTVAVLQGCEWTHCAQRSQRVRDTKPGSESQSDRMASTVLLSERTLGKKAMRGLERERWEFRAQRMKKSL